METIPKAPTLLEWSRMTPRSRLIFDKSNSVHSRIEEWKNHSHPLKILVALGNSQNKLSHPCRKKDHCQIESPQVKR
jgi:hypothetical protein